MSVDSLIELKNLIEDYPYWQTAQILYLLNLKRLGEDVFDARLPHTAIRVYDRQRLKAAVEAVEDILATEDEQPKKTRTKSSSEKPATELHSAQSESLIAKQIVHHNNLDISDDDHHDSSEEDYEITIQPKEVKSFQNKTISDLLNLQRSKPTATDASSTKLISRVKISEKATPDDILLEQLRQEALSKINERLAEVRNITSGKPPLTEPPRAAPPVKKIVSAKALIDKVIETNPKISKVESSDTKQKALTHWKAKEEWSLREDYELVSETLARLYGMQGAPEKAIEIYKTLTNQFPEKAEYFTSLIKRIKTNHKPKTKK
jgi:tetratricopeptide (TPR) repeat protein